MHAPHVVVQIPSTRKSESRNGTITSLPQAQVGVVSVAMESVGLALMAEQACIGGETQVGFQAGGGLAAVGLQVGIQIFVVSAFLRGGLVVAGIISNSKWAVVLSITLGGHGVVMVLSRVTRLGTVLGLLSRCLSHRERREELGFGLDLGLGRGWQSTSTGLLRRPDGPVRVFVTQRSAGEQRIRWVYPVTAHWRVGEIPEECVIGGQI